MNFKCVIVEDNEIDIDLLKMFINKIDFIDVECVFNDPLEAQKYIMKNNIDLIISDIMLPNITGLEMIKTLKNPPLVIFMTSYPDYALEGFELNAVDYLVKPIRFERFLKAVNRAWQRRNISEIQTSIHKSNNSLESDHFFIRSDLSFVKIFYKDVAYIQSVKDYVRIVTNAESHLTAMNLGTIEEKLPPEDFIRIHRSFIVRKDKIESLKNSELTVSGHLLGIGKNFKDIVYNAVVNKNFIKR